MTYQELMQQLKTRQKGSLIRITYQTTPPLTATARRDGFSVTKIVETTVRWGCNYSHLKAVQQKRSEQEALIAAGEIPAVSSTRPPWWRWKVGNENIIKQHLKLDENQQRTEYLTVQTLPKGGYPKAKYLLNGHPVSKTELVGMNIVQNSYWNNDNIETYDIKLQNIIAIKPKTTL